MLHNSDRDLIRAPASERVRLSVLRRTLLATFAFLLAVPGAYLVWSPRHVTYTAEGNLWIVTGAPRDRRGATPEGAGSIGGSSAWIDLLRSHEVLDPVVDRLLSTRPRDGRAVQGPRDGAHDLSQRLMVSTSREGRFIRVALEGADAQETANIVNAVMDRAVDVAGKLKQARLDEAVMLLEEQLVQAQLEVERAEHDLEAFRVGAIGAPAGRSSSPDGADATEARLGRRVQLSESLVNELRGRLEAARIAAASSTPDLSVLDRASVPDRPSRSGRLPLAAVLLTCLALVAGGTLFLERRPETASMEATLQG